MEFFDSHAHYNDAKFDEDRDEIIKKIYENGIKKIVVAGYGIESSKCAIRLAQMYDFIYATCGISPNDLEDFHKIEEIKKMASHPKVVAIGEIGLDYYWEKDNKEKQKEVFMKQIAIANEMEKPIVIHSRDASIDTISVLKEKTVNKKGVFHCAQLNIELIYNAIELGYYISFAGPITYKNSKNANEVIQMMPLDRILIETDCPYLSPEPLRGTRNHSGNLKYIAQKVAEVKNISLEKVAQITFENTRNIFHI